MIVITSGSSQQNLMKTNLKRPKVSIGIPVYNGEKFVAEAIESVLCQTFEDIELVISDNASTDRTPEICQAYAAKDERVHYFRAEKNLGAAWNFNRVFELSQGEYFQWLSHDDLIAPECLQKCVPVLDSDPSVVLSYPLISIIDEKRNFLTNYTVKLKTDSCSPAARFQELVLEWSMCFEIFGLIRSNALRMTPVMGNYGHGDGVLLARLGLLGRFVGVEEKLFFSRRHASQSMKQFGTSAAGGNNYHLYTVWFDPSKANRVIFPNWRIFFELATSIWKYPLNLKNRISCHITLLKWLRKAAKALIRDLWIAARFLVHRMGRK